MSFTKKVVIGLLTLSLCVMPRTVRADDRFLSNTETDKAIVTARLWGKDKPPTTDLQFHLRIQNLVNTFSMKASDIATVNKSVKSIALYRYIDAGRLLLKPNAYRMVEDTLTGKILAAKSFAIKECLECDPEKLIVRESWIPSLGGTRFGKNLTQIAGRVQVDGFLLWNVYASEEQLYLSVSIINARSGGVVWSGRYNEAMVPVKVKIKPDSEYEKIITFGLWGHEISRTYKTTTLVASEDIVGVGSIRIRRDAKDNKNFMYGVGIDYFKNVYTKDDTDLSGLTVYAHLNYKADRRLFGDTSETVEPSPIEPTPSTDTASDGENVSSTTDPTIDLQATPKPPPKYISKYNLYLDLGQAFFMNEQTEFFKTGFELRTKGGYIFDIGAVYLPKTEAIMTVPSGYNPTVSFGGTSIELTLGYLF